VVKKVLKAQLGGPVKGSSFARMPHLNAMRLREDGHPDW
jgi:hypothetical protein